MQVLFFLLQLSVVGEREKCTVDPRIPKVSIVFIPVGEWCVCEGEKCTVVPGRPLGGHHCHPYCSPQYLAYRTAPHPHFPIFVFFFKFLRSWDEDV